MAPAKPHVKKAFIAMKALGIEDGKIKSVLKKLLAVYDNNWELIAEDNYRALADAIFEDQESEMKGGSQEIVVVKKEKPEEAGCSAVAVDRGKKKAPESVEEDEEVLAESERPLKRLRRRGEGDSPLALSKSSSPRESHLQGN